VFVLDEKPPTVRVIVKLQSTGELLSNFTLLVFDESGELILQKSTQTDHLVMELPRGLLSIGVEKINIAADPQPVMITAQTTNISLVVRTA
jgi:hypothetical protein